jgi:hypothetical protein
LLPVNANYIFSGKKDVQIKSPFRSYYLISERTKTSFWGPFLVSKTQYRVHINKRVNLSGLKPVQKQRIKRIKTFPFLEQNMHQNYAIKDKQQTE